MFLNYKTKIMFLRELNFLIKLELCHLFDKKACRENCIMGVYL